MKNKLLLVVATIIMAASTNKTHAQEFMAEDINVNVGFGFWGYLSFTNLGDFRSSPLLTVSVDYGYMDDIGPGTIGIGGMLGYKSSSYVYNYYGYTDKGRWTDIVVGGRASYHFYLDIPKVDIYAVANLGIVVESYDYSSNSPFVFEPDVNTTDINLYGGFCGGAKYFLTDNIAAFAEVGYDVAWIKLGATLKL